MAGIASKEHQVMAFTFDKGTDSKAIAKALGLELKKGFLCLNHRQNVELVAPIFWNFVRIPLRYEEIIVKAQASEILQEYGRIN